VHHSGSVCPGCGGTRFAKLGEDVTEVVEKIAARLKVIHHVRPKLSCRCCERIVQAPAPDLPIEKGRPGPGLVANVVVSKYVAALPSICSLRLPPLGNYTKAACLLRFNRIGGRNLR
jgi:transposase